MTLSTSELRLFLCELAERALTEKNLIDRPAFRYALETSRQYAHTPTRKAFRPHRRDFCKSRCRYSYGYEIRT